MREGWTLLLVDREGGQTRRVRVPGWGLPVLVAVVALVCLAAVLVGISLG